jgi:hypothetical protein
MHLDLFQPKLKQCFHNQDFPVRHHVAYASVIPAIGGIDLEGCGPGRSRQKIPKTLSQQKKLHAVHMAVIPATAGSINCCLGQPQQKAQPLLKNKQSKKGWR